MLAERHVVCALLLRQDTAPLRGAGRLAPTPTPAPRAGPLQPRCVRVCAARMLCV